jgi:CTP synthase (UTP-ammonia lyase)
MISVSKSITNGYQWLRWIKISNGSSSSIKLSGSFVPASPYRSMQGTLNGIWFARDHLIPLLGTCGDFQQMIIESARNVMGLTEADHAEENPSASLILVAPLTCSVSEKMHTFKLPPGSKAALW